MLGSTNGISTTVPVLPPHSVSTVTRSPSVERRINGLEMDGDPFPELNNVKWPIVDGGREIGRVTSAIYSPRLERNIGFAWLPVERSTLGERVTVETEWGARTGTVVEMPFFDPSKQIPVS